MSFAGTISPIGDNQAGEGSGDVMEAIAQLTRQMNEKFESMTSDASRASSKLYTQCRAKELVDLSSDHYLGGLVGAWNEDLKLENLLKWK